MPIEMLLSTVDAYLEWYPEEAARLANLTRHIQEDLDDTVLGRKNFRGHVTCAGFVVALDTRRILLIDHLTLKRKIQPGGHFEPELDASLLAAAKREVQEETGILQHLTYTPLDPKRPQMPFDIDVHHIPANPRKQEPDHDHYDFRYLFTAPHERDLQAAEGESTGFAWTSFDEFRALEPTFEVVAAKIEPLLS